MVSEKIVARSYVEVLRRSEESQGKVIEFTGVTGGSGLRSKVRYHSSLNGGDILCTISYDKDVYVSAQCLLSAVYQSVLATH